MHKAKLRLLDDNRYVSTIASRIGLIDATVPVLNKGHSTMVHASSIDQELPRNFLRLNVHAIVTRIICLGTRRILYLSYSMFYCSVSQKHKNRISPRKSVKKPDSYDTAYIAHMFTSYVTIHSVSFFNSHKDY